MDVEIANLRQEVSQLRTQLSSAQLSFLDCDGAKPAQQQDLSEAGTIHQSSTSPSITTVPENSNSHKRKASDIGGDQAFRAREFRNEINKRQAMPPPPLPLSKQQYPNSIREEQYSGQRQGTHQEQRVDYSNQLGHSPEHLQQQVYRDQSSSRDSQFSQHTGQLGGSSIQQHFPVGYEKELIDLTESTESSTRPPLQRSQGRFITQQQQGGSLLRKDYADNINIPFQSPISSIPGQGIGDRHFAPTDYQSPKARKGYGANFHSPGGRTGNFSPLVRQGKDAGYFYDRGRQSAAPNTPRTSNIEVSSVVSPFFTNSPAKLGSSGLQLSAIGNGIRRPASVASFVGEQSNLNRSYGAGLGGGRFFSRQNDSLNSGVPDWSTPRFGKMGMFSGEGEIRPGTVQGFIRSETRNIFSRGIGGGDSRGGIGSASRGGIVERPGLRRSLRRD